LNIPEQAKLVIDAGGVGLTGAAVMEVVPPVTAVVALIWVLLRIWESETVKKVTNRWVEPE